MKYINVVYYCSCCGKFINTETALNLNIEFTEICDKCRAINVVKYDEQAKLVDIKTIYVSGLEKW